MTNSRQADKFVVRLPDGMRDQIDDAAVAQRTSMNHIIVKALENYLDGQQRQKILLDALSEKLKRLEEV
ncbi:Arc family DNA-binding protein [Azotobacter salinestris]|uniref:Arc family DNA-binding protein n=1 Tax=Azotobacter salinestris TaxID=69964 RepID=UPI0032DE9954